MDLELRATDGGGEPDILGTKPPALAEHHRASLDVLAGMAPVGAALDSGRNHDAVAFAGAVLLHQHRVGAGRHRRAGEDADRLSARRRPVRALPGRDPPAHGQPGIAVPVEVVEIDRVAVDRRVVVRRNRERRRQIGGEDPAARPPQRNGLAAGDDIEPLREQRERLAGGHQRAAEGEAVVGELRHRQAAPLAAERSPQ